MSHRPGGQWQNIWIFIKFLKFIPFSDLNILLSPIVASKVNSSTDIIRNCLSIFIVRITIFC